MMGAADVSSRGAASLLEVGRTITAWPQLGSEVTLGAATAAAVVRRFGLKGHLPSGRVRIDIDESIDGLAPVPVPRTDGRRIDRRPAVPDRCAERRRRHRSDRRRRAARAVRRQHPAMALRGRRQRDPLLPRAGADDRDGRPVPGELRGIGAALFNARVDRGGGATARARSSCSPRATRRGTSRPFGSATPPTSRSRRCSPRIHTRAANRRIGRARRRSTHSTLQLLTRARRARGCAAPAPHRPRPDRRDCGELLAESDRIRFLTPTLHREMMAELRVPGRDTVDEGIDVRTLELGPAELGVARAASPPRRDGAPRRVASRPGARDADAGQRHDELGDGGDRGAARRSDLLRARRCGRRALLAHRGGARPRGAPGVTRVPLRGRRPRSGSGSSASATSTRSRDMTNRFNELFELADGEHVALLLRVSHAAPPRVMSARLPLTHLLSRQREQSPAMAVVQPWQNGASAGLGELRN